MDKTLMRQALAVIKEVTGLSLPDSFFDFCYMMPHYWIEYKHVRRPPSRIVIRKPKPGRGLRRVERG